MSFFDPESTKSIFVPIKKIEYIFLSICEVEERILSIQLSIFLKLCLTVISYNIIAASELL